MCDKILFTVIIPSYNHEKYVEQSIKSVWNQTYDNIELIVIDDGSNDMSWSIIKKLKKISPISMICQKQVNKGICKTLNLGLKIANGDLISTLASDDYYHKDFIKRNIDEYLKFENKFFVFHSDAHIIYHNSNKKLDKTHFQTSRIKPLEGSKPFIKSVSGKYRVVAPTLVIPKFLYDKIGCYDESMNAEDFDLQLRLAKVASFVFINEPLLFKRDSPKGLGKQPKIWQNDMIKSLKKHRDSFTENEFINILKIKYSKLSVAHSYLGDCNSFYYCFKKTFYLKKDITWKYNVALLFLKIWTVNFIKGFLKRNIPSNLHYNLKNKLR